MNKEEALNNFIAIKDTIKQFGEVFFDESDLPLIDTVIDAFITIKQLKEIALELLNKYNSAEKTVIWEYSDSIDNEVKALNVEVNAYCKKNEVITNG